MFVIMERIYWEKRNTIYLYHGMFIYLYHSDWLKGFSRLGLHTLKPFNERQGVDYPYIIVYSSE